MQIGIGNALIQVLTGSDMRVAAERARQLAQLLAHGKENRKSGGAKPYPVGRTNLENMKQYAMIFDELHIIELKRLLNKWPDLRYLQERGFIRDAILTGEERSILEMTDEQLNKFEFIRDNSDLKNAIIELQNEHDHLRDLSAKKPNTSSTMDDLLYLLSLSENYDEAIIKWSAYLSRIHALILRNQFGTNAISMEHCWESSRSIDRNATETDLYEIVINRWPMPSDIVPWEDILAFRSEVSSQQQLRALRLWVSDMAKGKLTIAEASEKIEYLKHEYRSYMKGASIQMGTSVLRTVVVGTAGLIENALKIKLKELAEAPFKLLDAKATLVDAERKAPGRELAYVVQVENKLSGGV